MIEETHVNTICNAGKIGDEDYSGLLNNIKAKFNAAGHKALFVTNADLWGSYLEGFPEAVRQHFNCSACRHFIQKYGVLASIGEDGIQASAIWDGIEAPEAYRPSIEAMSRLVRKAKVTGVFLTTEATWGTPETGPWSHYSVEAPDAVRYRRGLLTAGQAMAEKKEDYKNVSVALSEFPLPVVEQALRLLNSEAMYRSEKVLGPVQWLHDLHIARDAAKNKANVTWRAVAVAPAGFCHPRSSMAGTLMEDIAAGMDFNTIAKRFKDKMHPLQYQRPQAAPSAGNIENAEKIVAQLGIAASLRRRFARLEEIELIWKPTTAETENAEGGVFSHLKPKNKMTPQALEIPTVEITWDKFTRTVLPTAKAIEFHCEGRPGNYCALVTAADPSAPPILQWDNPSKRNPVSWYVYNGGSFPQHWNLAPDSWHDVTGICLRPSMWGGMENFSHDGKGAVLIIKGARETRNSGLALFPETLKAELRGIRATIEAFSHEGKIEGMEEATACGVALQDGTRLNILVRVATDGGKAKYRIDRWD